MSVGTNCEISAAMVLGTKKTRDKANNTMARSMGHLNHLRFVLHLWNTKGGQDLKQPLASRQFGVGFHPRPLTNSSNGWQSKAVLSCRQYLRQIQSFCCVLIFSDGSLEINHPFRSRCSTSPA